MFVSKLIAEVDDDARVEGSKHAFSLDVDD